MSSVNSRRPLREGARRIGQPIKRPVIAEVREPELNLLSETELDILRLASRWMTNQEIAQELGYSAFGVQTHLNRIYARLDVRSQTEAVLHAIKKGWLP